MALERMLAGLSTRRYPVGLEPVGGQVDEKSSATSKSAVSRRFVAMTETALAELLSADLSGLDLVALMIDGVHFAESCCVVALGIDIEGTKHPLALVEGSTENATLVTGLIVGPAGTGPGCHPSDAGRVGRVQGAAQGRGRRARPPGHPTLSTAQDQKCPGPSARRLEARGPQDAGRVPARRRSPAKPRCWPWSKLDRPIPGRPRALREGLEETLTVLASACRPPARTLRSTNAIESMI